MDISNIHIPTVTLNQAREWFEYMRDPGTDDEEIDVLGECLFADITLRELQWFIPAARDNDWLAGVSVRELCAMRDHFVEINPGFIALRERLAKMGGDLLKAAV